MRPGPTEPLAARQSSKITSELVMIAVSPNANVARRPISLLLAATLRPIASQVTRVSPSIRTTIMIQAEPKAVLGSAPSIGRAGTLPARTNPGLNRLPWPRAKPGPANQLSAQMAAVGNHRICKVSSETVATVPAPTRESCKVEIRENPVTSATANTTSAAVAKVSSSKPARRNPSPSHRGRLAQALPKRVSSKWPARPSSTAATTAAKSALKSTAGKKLLDEGAVNEPTKAAPALVQAATTMAETLNSWARLIKLRASQRL